MGENSMRPEKSKGNAKTRVVDAHVHVWDAARFSMPWLDYLPALRRRFAWSEYWHEVCPAVAIFVECAVSLADTERELRWILRYAQREKRIAGVVAGCDLAQRDFAVQLRTRSDPLVKGLRQVLLPGAGAIASGRVITRSLAQIASAELAFDLCIDAGRLQWANRVAIQHPDLRLILDHCGLPPTKTGALNRWRRDILVLGERPNVACKISGLRAHLSTNDGEKSRLNGILESVYQAFGEDRLLYGTDWPLCNLDGTAETWRFAIQQFADTRPGLREKLFKENAIHWYRLARITA